MAEIRTPEKEALIRARQRKLWRHQLASRGLEWVGRFLPPTTRRFLAKRSPRLGHLLRGDGEFVIHDYLGTLSVHIDVRSATERDMLTSRYETDVLKVIESRVRPGDVCLDIGANVGAIALPLARKVGPAGRVHCVEPGPDFFRRLSANVRLNTHLAPVLTLHQVGLSDGEGTLFWQQDPLFPGNAWMLGKSGVAVRVTTLDELASGFGRLDFIKMDVEGMEYEILQGGRETLRRLRPAVLFESSLEFEGIRGLPVRRLSEELLRSLGYRLHAVGRGGALLPSAYPNVGRNTLALPPADLSQGR